SNDEEHIVQLALGAGCDRYLAKPAPREALWSILAGFAPAPQARGDAALPGARDAVLVDADLEHTLPEFRASRLQLLAELPAALAAGDRIAFRRLAHRLAGSFALYGFDWAAAQCRALAADVGNGDAAALRAQIDAVRAHFAEVEVRFALLE